MTPGAAAKKTVCNGLGLLIENIHGEFGTHTISTSNAIKCTNSYMTNALFQLNDLI